MQQRTRLHLLLLQAVSGSVSADEYPPPPNSGVRVHAAIDNGCRALLAPLTASEGPRGRLAGGRRVRRAPPSPLLSYHLLGWRLLALFVFTLLWREREEVSLRDFKAADGGVCCCSGGTKVSGLAGACFSADGTRWHAALRCSSLLLMTN